MTATQHIRLLRNRLVWGLKHHFRWPARVRRLTKWGALESLKQGGLQPTTILDVGVEQGTPELLYTFPDAKHVLIEPVREHEALIRGAYRRIRNVHIVWAAAHSEAGIGSLSVTRSLDTATLRPSVGERWNPELSRQVELVTLDALCEKDEIEGPYLLKVDVDGTDLEVLKGAQRVLGDTDCVVIESSSEQIVERASFLQDQGFFLWGIVDVGFKREVLYQMDLVFLRARLGEDEHFVPWAAPGGMELPLCSLTTWR